MPLSGLRAQLLLDELPFNARGIDVEDKVGDFIPLDAMFKDERGNKTGIGRYFKKGKPIVLTLNYSNCPGLCVAQLDNLVRTLRATDAKGMGDDFEIVTISIDPNERPTKAAETKAKYTAMLRSDKATDAWHFMTGDQRNISKIAEAVGFRYTYDKANKRYNHPAATYFISPDGRICRYLLSLGVEPQQFSLAVAEANDGKLTLSVTDAIIQFCYLYNPDANRYSASARRMLAFAAAAFCLLLLGGTAPFWFRGKKPPNSGQVAKSADSGGQEIEANIDSDGMTSSSAYSESELVASNISETNLVTGTTE